MTITENTIHRATHATALVCALLMLFALACNLIGCANGTDANDEDPTAMTSADNGAQEKSATETEDADVDDTQTADTDAEEKTDGALSDFTICIDAGHGSNLGTDSYPNSPYSDETGMVQPLGASGAESGNEYEVNLDVALYLQDELEDMGATVVQVRTDNDVTISPKQRAETANDCDADIFVRLHCDSAGSSVSGFLTLIPGDKGYQSDGDLYKTSQAMGEQMHDYIVEELGCGDRGTTVRYDQGGFNWCKVPCVLFEMGNMDNASDDALLAADSYKKELAAAIAHACEDYLT